MSRQTGSFSPAQRGLHWLMAVMVLAMLFIGIGMVTTLAPLYLTLVSIHKPLGIAILALVLIRIALRLKRGAPALPAEMPRSQQRAAQASHLLLYGLLLAMPLIGWAMLSAGGYPVVLCGFLTLPPIAPHDDRLHALLWSAHQLAAYLLFATILLHLAAALFHGLIRRDGVFGSMALGKRN